MPDTFEADYGVLSTGRPGAAELLLGYAPAYYTEAHADVYEKPAGAESMLDDAKRGVEAFLGNTSGSLARNVVDPIERLLGDPEVMGPAATWLSRQSDQFVEYSQERTADWAGKPGPYDVARSGLTVATAAGARGPMLLLSAAQQEDSSFRRAYARTAEYVRAQNPEATPDDVDRIAVPIAKVAGFGNALLGALIPTRYAGGSGVRQFLGDTAEDAVSQKLGDLADPVTDRLVDEYAARVFSRPQDDLSDQAERAVEAVASRPIMFEVQVQPGDTLSQLARKFGVSQQELVAMNNIADPDRIRAGQVLVMPLDPK